MVWSPNAVPVELDEVIVFNVTYTVIIFWQDIPYLHADLKEVV